MSESCERICWKKKPKTNLDSFSEGLLGKFSRFFMPSGLVHSELYNMLSSWSGCQWQSSKGEKAGWTLGSAGDEGLSVSMGTACAL